METSEGLKFNDSDSSLFKGAKISINRTVEKLKGAWRPTVFARCFPSLAGRHEKSLEAIRVRVLEAVVEALFSDISQDIEEFELLNKLDSLVNKSSCSKNIQAWRPTGSPDKDTVSHDWKVMLHEKQRLEECLEAQKKKRLKLFAVVKERRNECHLNHLKIKKQTTKLQELNTLADALPTEEMKLYFRREMTQ